MPAGLGRNGIPAWIAGVRESLRASFWFVPGLVTLLSAGLAIALVVYQDPLDALTEELVPWLFQGEPGSARAVLGAIAGSMATVAATTFSVTMVALTLAAGQFSPRVLRSFMRDRMNQVVLGTFIGTFTYSLIVLRAVRSTGEEVPNLAVTVGFTLVLASLVLLIVFIHHIAEAVQVSTLIEGITGETVAQIPHLYPEELGAPAHLPADPPPTLERAATVRARGYGYVRVLDYDRLLRAARSGDVLIRLHASPGDFVSFGGALAEVGPPERLTPAIEEAIRRSHLLARYPSIEQDVRFGIRQLADIAVRALSPGINDPTTATNCIDYLGVILARLVGRRFPAPNRKADDGRVLVVTSRPGFADMVRLAFDQIRLYGERDPRVLTRLVETLVHLSEQSEDLERLAPLARMASAVERTAESLEPEWRDRLLPLARRVALRGHGDAREAARTAGVVH